MRTAILCKTAIGLALGLAANTGAIAEGMLDDTYGGNGVDAFVVPPTGGGEEKIFDGIVDDQDRTVMVGYFGAGTTRPGLVLRRTKQGTADASFGDGGKLVIAPPPGYTRFVLRGVEIRTDGRIVVAGDLQETINLGDGAKPMVCRLTAAGAIDTTFAGNGCRVLSYRETSDIDTVTDMKLQLDNKIVLYGASGSVSIGPIALARLTADGDDDLCFGDAGCTSGGYRIDPLPVMNSENPTRLAIAPNGRILVTGGNSFGGPAKPFVARFLSSGAVDAGYGTGGIAELQDGMGTAASPGRGISVLADGSVLVGREHFVGDIRYAAVNKVDANGNAVAAFGTAGFATVAYSDVSTHNFVANVVALVDGTFVVAGTSATSDTTSGVFGVARFRANGTLDERFGFNGTNTATGDLFPQSLNMVTSMSANIRSVTLYGDTRNDNGNLDFQPMAVRFDNDALLRDSFED